METKGHKYIKSLIIHCGNSFHFTLQQLSVVYREYETIPSVWGVLL